MLECDRADIRKGHFYFYWTLVIYQCDKELETRTRMCVTTDSNEVFERLHSP